jgi:hypothetical protein
MQKFARVMGLLLAVIVLTLLTSDIKLSGRGKAEETNILGNDTYSRWLAPSTEDGQTLLAVAVYHHRGNVKRFFSRSQTSRTHKSRSYRGRGTNDMRYRSHKSNCVYQMKSS